MDHKNQNLNIYDIRDILKEDQFLFDKTITRLMRRNSLTPLDADQPQHQLDPPGYGLNRSKIIP